MPLSFVKAIFALFTLFVSSIGVNALQMLSLCIYPFSKSYFRKTNTNLAGLWWTYCVFCIHDMSKIQIKISGDTLPTEENAILLPNHQTMPDILAILCLAYQNHRIRDLKWFAKSPLKYVPGIGWGMLFIDCIFLKRNWLKDQSSILKTFEKIRDHKNPFWIVSFLEGTRVTKEKILHSQNYAQQNSLPILKHVLLPRTKGFIATTKGLEQEFHAVYDICIGFEPAVPTLLSFFFQPTKCVHIHVKRFAKKDLPTTPIQRSQWVISRFQEKDQKMAHFLKHHSFPK